MRVGDEAGPRDLMRLFPAELMISTRVNKPDLLAAHSLTGQIPREDAIGDASDLADMQRERSRGRVYRLEHQHAPAVMTARSIALPGRGLFGCTVAVVERRGGHHIL